MAHLPPELLSGSSGFSKTLFLPWHSTDAVVVTRRGEKFSKRTLKFENAHAALDWCEKNHANFNYFQPSEPNLGVAPHSQN